jgi:hypothetical protein
MIRKDGNWFSEKIMLQQRQEIIIRSNQIMIWWAVVAGNAINRVRLFAPAFPETRAASI